MNPTLNLLLRLLRANPVTVRLSPEHLLFGQGGAFVFHLYRPTLFGPSHGAQVPARDLYTVARGELRRPRQAVLSVARTVDTDNTNDEPVRAGPTACGAVKLERCPVTVENRGPIAKKRRLKRDSVIAHFVDLANLYLRVVEGDVTYVGIGGVRVREDALPPLAWVEAHDTQS